MHHRWLLGSPNITGGFSIALRLHYLTIITSLLICLLWPRAIVVAVRIRHLRAQLSHPILLVGVLRLMEEILHQLIARWWFQPI